MSLTLAPTGLEHTPAIQRLAAHPDVAATSLMPHPYPDDGAVRFIEDVVLPGRASGTQYGFAILDGVELVGHLSLKNVDRERGEAEIGYWVGRPYWGRGYASEAVRLAVAFAFEDLGCGGSTRTYSPTTRPQDGCWRRRGSRPSSCRPRRFRTDAERRGRRWGSSSCERQIANTLWVDERSLPQQRPVRVTRTDVVAPL